MCSKTVGFCMQNAYKNMFSCYALFNLRIKLIMDSDRKPKRRCLASWKKKVYTIWVAGHHLNVHRPLCFDQKCTHLYIFYLWWCKQSIMVRIAIWVPYIAIYQGMVQSYCDSTIWSIVYMESYGAVLWQTALWQDRLAWTV